MPNDPVTDKLKSYHSACEDSLRLIKDLKGKINEVYLERNRLVAALSKLFPSWMAQAEIKGWWCVYIALPTGQVSWHFHESHHPLFSHINDIREGGGWDGHSTSEKYNRLSAIECC